MRVVERAADIGPFRILFGPRHFGLTDGVQDLIEVGYVLGPVNLDPFLGEFVGHLTNYGYQSDCWSRSQSRLRLRLRLDLGVDGGCLRRQHPLSGEQSLGLVLAHQGAWSCSGGGRDLDGGLGPVE